MVCAARDPIEQEVEEAVEGICASPSTVLTRSTGQSMPQSEGSSVIFLGRSVSLTRGKPFIPTPHLIEIFERRRRRMENKESLNLFCALSSHALTRAPAGWAHEKATHERLGTGGAVLSIFRDNIKKDIPRHLCKFGVVF